MMNERLIKSLKFICVILESRTTEEAVNYFEGGLEIARMIKNRQAIKNYNLELSITKHIKKYCSLLLNSNEINRVKQNEIRN